MYKFIQYLSITLLLWGHATYGASSAAKDADVVSTPTATAGVGAGAGAESEDIAAAIPETFEERATKMLSQEPYKSRHASDCCVLMFKDDETLKGYGTGTLMQTDGGRLCILTAAHILKAKPDNIYVVFSDGIMRPAIAGLTPSPGKPFFEEGCVHIKTQKHLINIQIIDGKIINYLPPYGAWKGATVTRADGSEEFVPGLDGLSSELRPHRESYMRDYMLLILKEYSKDIMPAKIQEPTPQKIPGDDTPQERILCSLSGFGPLISEDVEGIRFKMFKLNKWGRSFRLLPLEPCATQGPVVIAQQDFEMDLKSLGTFLGPYAILNIKDSEAKVICKVSGVEPGGVIEFLPLPEAGLAVPVYEGFSGSSLRNKVSGEIIGLVCCYIPENLNLDGAEGTIHHTICHNMIQERDRIHGLVDDYYVNPTNPKYIHLEAEALKRKQRRQLYSTIAINFALMVFIKSFFGAPATC